jgi:putative sugar O-methyltransferase
MAIGKLREWFVRARQTSSQRRLEPEDQERIANMFSALDRGEQRARPSRYWEELNKMNLAQLNEHGYENFKRTIALNYFTWVRILPWDSQIVFLCKNLPWSAIMRSIGGAFRISTQRYFSSLDVLQSFSYGLLSSLLWEYVLRSSLGPSLLALREPSEGNPPLLYPRPAMRVSQDLANSLLEYDSFQSAIPLSGGGTVLELGGGYGRNAFVILRVHPKIKYVLVDIPPALWIAEKYLTSVFPDKRVFRFRDFAKFEDVADEYARAQIVFLLSSQLAMLPRDSVALVINISSLHEMRKDQVAYYLDRFAHVLKPGGHMYIKQWREAKVLFEGVTLVEKDYPIPHGWTKEVSRTARVQTKFFEALYQKPPESASSCENASHLPAVT